MSINFKDPMNEDARRIMEELCGKPVATDERTALFNNMRTIRQPEMNRLANAAKQPITVEIHSDGDIKTMSDGTRYRVTPLGWKRLPA